VAAAVSHNDGVFPTLQVITLEGDPADMSKNHSAKVVSDKTAVAAAVSHNDGVFPILQVIAHKTGSCAGMSKYQDVGDKLQWQLLRPTFMVSSPHSKSCASCKHNIFCNL
jgi:hypothetical protein